MRGPSRSVTGCATRQTGDILSDDMFVYITDLDLMFGEPMTEGIDSTETFLNGMDGIALLTQC
jgi:hypothetical protein